MTNSPFPTSTQSKQPFSDSRSGNGNANHSASADPMRKTTGADSSDMDTHEQRKSDHAQGAQTVQTAHKLVDQAAERVGPAVDKIKQHADQASVALHDHIDRFDQTQQRWTDDSRTAIRSNPLTWVASALAVGMLLGRMRSGR